MPRLFIFTIFLMTVALSAQDMQLTQAIEHALETAKRKIGYTLDEIDYDSTQYPSTTYYDTFRKYWYWNTSTVNESSTGGWAPGFWPGCLWQMYEITGEEEWMTYAKTWTSMIENRLYNGGSDVGVNVFNTFEPQYRATGNEHNIQVLFEAARRIIGERNSNFNEKAGVLGYDRKADIDGKNHWQAFIDHLPNLELLYWAAEHTPDSTEKTAWQRIATSHALTVGKHMINPLIPGSDPVEYRTGSIQRGYFDYGTGAYLFGEAKQGWTHNSTWSRGQSWIVYGFSAAYAGTQNDSILMYLKTAADYFIDHLPANLPGDRQVPGDYVPQWDFDYTSQRDTDNDSLLYPDTERDASAGAMGAAGLFKLVQALPPDDPDRMRYWNAARKILSCLCSSAYLAEGDETPAIVLHGCYVHPQSYLGRNSNADAKDLSLIWGDFYFLYSINLYQQLAPILSKVNKGKTPVQFNLYQNYPNPFNNQTTLSFSISQTEKVSLWITNILGQRIKTFPEDNYSSGYHRIRWDGRSNSGDPVSSGIYFIHLRADNLEHTMKMVLIR